MKTYGVHGVVEKTIETPTHGRFLLSPGPATPRRLLLGFHGYGETAEDHLRRLIAISANNYWTIASVQGLHQFYRRRTDEIVASWMTRQNREIATADNVEYVTRVVRSIADDDAGNATLAVTGFSQGAAMAYRAAALLPFPVCGLVACGGDVPPELGAELLQRIPAVLIGRGLRDEWYTAEKMASDETRLRSAGVRVEAVTLDAGHEWTAEFGEACFRFLQSSLANESTL